MAKLVLDPHDIYNRGDQIERELNRVIQEAIEKRIKVEKDDKNSDKVEFCS